MEATCEAVSRPGGLWEGKRGPSYHSSQRASTFSMHLEGWAGTSHPGWTIQDQHGQGEARKEEPLGFSPSHCTPVPSQEHSHPREDSLPSTGCCSTSPTKQERAKQPFPWLTDSKDGNENTRASLCLHLHHPGGSVPQIRVTCCWHLCFRLYLYHQFNLKLI